MHHHYQPPRHPVRNLSTILEISLSASSNHILITSVEVLYRRRPAVFYIVMITAGIQALALSHLENCKYGNHFPTHCFPGGTVVKNPPANAGDARHMGSIPGVGRSPGGRNGNPLQYSCLGNFLDRGAWWATVHGVANSRT